jgi:aminoglycoside phosphotransferase (APT) family kinase protein
VSLGVVVPAEVTAALRPKVGTLRRIEPTFGGFSNLSFFAETDQARRVVVKATSSERKIADLRNETLVLTALAETALPVPHLVASVSAPPWQLTVLDRIEATPGLALVQTRDVVELSARARLLGELLRSVHQSAPFSLAGASLWLHHRLETDAHALERHGAVDAQIRDQLDVAMHHRALERGVALLHGDAGFHNTLWDDDGSPSKAVRLRALVDWEWAAYGNPLFDLAWVWWTMRFRRIPTAVFDVFLDAYGRSAVAMSGWDRELVLAFVRAQMGAILSRTEPGSAAAEEWLRRLAALPRLRVPDRR